MVSGGRRIGRGTKLLASCLVVGLLVAGACGDATDDEVATLSETKPPAPVETAEPPPPAPAPVPPEPAPSEPPPAEAPQPADATATEEPPPPEPSPASLPEGELDAAAVAALVASVDAAQSGVTSSLEQLYLTMELSSGGQSMGSVSAVPYALSTTVGDLTHVMIDQSALEAGLRSGRIGGAFLDVVWPEPHPPESTLWDAPNLFITPHVGADDIENYIPEVFRIALGNMERFFAGKRLRNVVNRRRGY